MLVKYAVIDGTAFPLPDNSIPKLVEINDYLDARFDQINKEFPNEEIKLTYQEGKTLIETSDQIRIRLNVLDNENALNK